MCENPLWIHAQAIMNVRSPDILVDAETQCPCRQFSHRASSVSCENLSGIIQFYSWLWMQNKPWIFSYFYAWSCTAKPTSLNWSSAFYLPQYICCMRLYWWSVRGTWRFILVLLSMLVLWIHNCTLKTAYPEVHSTPFLNIVPIDTGLLGSKVQLGSPQALMSSETILTSTHLTRRE